MKGRTSLVSRFAASTAFLAASVILLAIAFFVVTRFDFFRSAIKTSLRGFSLILAERVWDYPDRDCTQKTVSWYRFAINQGRMEKVGFPCPEDGLQNPRRVAAAEKKAEKEAKRKERVANKSEKTETKKVARRKVARRKS